MKKKLLLRTAAVVLGLALVGGSVGAAISSIKAVEVSATDYSETLSTVTYTVSTKTKVNTSGTPMAGSVATYSQTYGTAKQMTGGNSITLTLSGYDKAKITGLTVSVHSNKSAGSGSLSFTSGDNTIASISSSAFNSSNWYGAWSQTFVDKVVTCTETIVGKGENLVLAISAATNSLFFESATISYYAPVSNPISEIALVDAPTGNLEIGDTQQLSYYALDSEAEEWKGSVVYSSDDETVVTISETGLLTAVGAGSTTIYVQDSAKTVTSDKVNVTVIADPERLDLPVGLYTIDVNYSSVKKGDDVPSSVEYEFIEKSGSGESRIWYKNLLVEYNSNVTASYATEYTFAENGVATFTNRSNAKLKSIEISYYNTNRLSVIPADSEEALTPASSSSNIVTYDVTSDSFIIQNSSSSPCSIYYVKLYYEVINEKEKLYSVVVSKGGSWDKSSYAEGEAPSEDGLVVTANYSDNEGESFTRSVDVTEYAVFNFGKEALEFGDTSFTVTATYDEKTSAEFIVDGITVKKILNVVVSKGEGWNKTDYKVGNAPSSEGLEVTVNYTVDGTSISDSEKVTDGITWKFSTESLEAVMTSFSVTATYAGVESAPFEVTGITVTTATGDIASGRYYIVTNDLSVGLNAEAATSSSPSAVDLSKSNSLTAFDVTLVDDNAYEITTTISSTKYYLVCNTKNETGSNSSIRIISNNFQTTNKTWNLSKQSDDVYHVTQNTTGSVNRYLAAYNSQDWRGYVSTTYGNPLISFIPENSLSAKISEVLSGDLCDSSGVSAPSTEKWGEMTTYIAHEVASLKNAKYEIDLEGNIVAKEGTSQAWAEAAARYDYIIGKYGKAAYADFAGRHAEEVATAKYNTANYMNNAGIFAIVGAIAGVSIVAGAAFIVVKKKKQK